MKYKDKFRVECLEGYNLKTSDIIEEDERANIFIVFIDDTYVGIYITTNNSLILSDKLSEDIIEEISSHREEYTEYIRALAAMENL